MTPSFQRTCIFRVYLTDGNHKTKKTMATDALLNWFQRQTTNFNEYFNIHQITFKKGFAPDLFEVSYIYQNIDPEWDEGKMAAELIIDPDDDCNYPFNDCCVCGKIVFITGRIEITN